MNRLVSVSFHLILGLALFCAGRVERANAQETLLRLAETATVMVSPDELAATLRAEALAPSTQDAQKRVNEMMRDAVALAKKVAGINVSTGPYNVWRIGPSPGDRNERWQAGQSLNLTGKDAETMLRLVGDLQQRGLAQGNLLWRLSRDAERKARKDATRLALAGLHARADEAADVLNLKFASFREVRLDSVSPPPVMSRQAAPPHVGTAIAAPPPTAEAEDIPVTASAEADIVLKPR